MIRSGVVEIDDDTRFDAIFEAHHAEILRYCARRLGGADGEDAAAEVFAIAWRRLDEMPEDEGRRSWLFGVAHRVVSNNFRSRARRSRLAGRLAGNDRGVGRDVTSVVAETEPILIALASLKPNDQEILRMVAWDGLTRGEIAGIMGIRENSVDQRIFRARARLRRRLDDRNGPMDRSET